MWQPIETAPKDNQVLLYCPRRGVVRGWWKDCRHSSKPRPYWTHDRERTYGVIETRDDQPTHWMPLPDAPGAQAQPAPSVPDGWQLVPSAESRHPGIYKMLGALHAADNTPGMSEWESYQAMLAAAPEAKP